MRACGDCQACCKVMPIGEIGKPANQRCGFQKFKVGCKVHGTASQPSSCKRWSCWWLLDATFDLPRPDRAGYVVDPTPDFVIFGENAFAGKRVQAIQVWVDASRPEAWGGCVDWLKRQIGDRELVAVIRFGNDAAITLIPPQLAKDHVDRTGMDDETADGWALIDSRVLPVATAHNIRTGMAHDAQQAMAEKMKELSDAEKEV